MTPLEELLQLYESKAPPLASRDAYTQMQGVESQDPRSGLLTRDSAQDMGPGGDLQVPLTRSDTTLTLPELMSQFEEKQSRDKRRLAGEDSIARGLSGIGSTIANAYSARAKQPQTFKPQGVSDYDQQYADIEGRASPALRGALAAGGIDIPEGMDQGEIKMVAPVLERKQALDQSQANSDRSFALQEKGMNLRSLMTEHAINKAESEGGLDAVAPEYVREAFSQEYGVEIPPGATFRAVKTLREGLMSAKNNERIIGRQGTNLQNQTTLAQNKADISNKIKGEYTPTLYQTTLTDFRKGLDADPELKREMNALRVVNEIKKMVELGRSNQVGASVAVMDIARKLGDEKGPLSNQDLERWFGARGFAGLKQTFSLWTTGNFDDGSMNRLLEVIAVSEPAAKQRAASRLKSQMNRFKYETRAGIGAVQPEIYKDAEALVNDYASVYGESDAPDSASPVDDPSRNPDPVEPMGPPTAPASKVPQSIDMMLPDGRVIRGVLQKHVQQFMKDYQGSAPKGY
jgi:hypothetical protein